MDDAHRDALLTLLFDSANTDGSWGYAPGQGGAAEPTALAALVLRDVEPAAAGKAMKWLAKVQSPSGGVPIRAGLDGPFWPTAYCVLAWSVADAEPDARKRAIDWLLQAHGEPVDADAGVYDHDPTLIGWSWVAGTHSWVDPTATAVLALRAAGLGDHPRVREGVKLLLDRAMPDGGWNYGNRTVLGATLRPFPATTGTALAALGEHRSDPRVRRSAAYVTDAIRPIRAPLSLAWGLIGLAAVGDRPTDADDWLAQACSSAEEFGPLEWALLGLAVEPSWLMQITRTVTEAAS